MTEQGNMLKKIIKKSNNGTVNNIDNQQINVIEKQQNNNQTNIKQLNINLVAHGKEDLRFITTAQIKLILNKGFKSVEDLIKFTHFNRNHPECHNIYISNIKDTYCMIYDGEAWNLTERGDTLQQIYEDKSEYLVERFEELQEQLNEPKLKIM